MAKSPPGLAVTRYCVIGAPPLLAGAVNVTLACALPGVAVPIVGAPAATTGAVGVTLFDGAEGAPVPALLVAVTVNVYAVPLVSPVTTIGDPAPVLNTPPGLAVTRYCVIAAPPLLAGAVNVTLACALPALAVPIVGAPGAETGAVGVTLFDTADGALVPALLVAVTVNV